jgi:hypothetical protein
MKPEADRNCSAVRSENADASSRFSDKCKMARIFDWYRLVEDEKSAIYVNKGMNFIAIQEIELQPEWCDTCTVSSFALKSSYAANCSSRNNDAGGDSNRDRVQ